MRGFSVPARRRATSPAAVTTNSFRTRLADLVRLGRVGFVDDDLRDPVPVTQVEEDQLAVVAAAMDPAGETRVDPASAARNSPAVWVR